VGLAASGSALILSIAQRLDLGVWGAAYRMAMAMLSYSGHQLHYWAGHATRVLRQTGPR